MLRYVGYTILWETKAKSPPYALYGWTLPELQLEELCLKQGALGLLDNLLFQVISLLSVFLLL